RSFPVGRETTMVSDLSRSGRTGGCRIMRHVWICLVLAGCMVGPDYKRPDPPPAPAFKELAGWKISQPADTIDKGAWWSAYRDPELDRLEAMVDVSHQTIKEFEAQYRNAVALVGEARAGLFPTIGITPSVSRSGGGGGGLGSGGGGSSLASGGSGGGTGGSGGGRGTEYSITGSVS